MTIRAVGFWLALLAVLMNSAAPVLAQGVVAPAPQPTLWSFLGIPQAFKAVREGAINKSGNHPALEKKPPLKKIADPENLKSENPAIKKAAEIKKEEDLKWQKIKAIKYLTTIGCGCYNRDGSITDALMKAMDDCTEEVRYATILAINGAAGGEMCENCKMRSCCSEEVSNKLYELAYEKDDEGCFLEPSERVRLAAAEALRVCCPGRGDDLFFEGPPAGEFRPPIGEEPGVVPIPGGERPLDAPPPPPVPEPGEPTPAPPLPPAPMPTLRPISEPVPPAPVIQRHELPRDPVAQQETPRQEMPRQEMSRQEAPRFAVRLPEPPRVAMQPKPEILQAPAAKPTVVQGLPAPPSAAAAPIVMRPAVAVPTTPAQPIAAQPAAAKPAPTNLIPPSPAPTSTAPAQPAAKSSRRTANLPGASQAQPIAATEKDKPTSSPVTGSAPQVVAGKVPATTASLPFTGSTPHWTVGSKAPTVFISKPIEPAKPIESAKQPSPPAKSEADKLAPAQSAKPAAAPVATQPQATAQAEPLAPIIPASAMRRLPPPDDAPPAPQQPAPARAAHREAAPVTFVSPAAPAAKPIEASKKQRREIPGEKFGTGTIGSVRLRDGVAMIEFGSTDSVPTGSIIRAYHEYAFAARKTVGDLQVIRTEGHVAIAIPYNGSELTAFTVGDQAIVLR